MNKCMKLLVAADLVTLVGSIAIAATVDMLSPRTVYVVFGTDKSTVDTKTGVLFMFSVVAPLCVMGLREAIKPKLRVRERVAGVFVTVFIGTMAVGAFWMLFR